MGHTGRTRGSEHTTDGFVAGTAPPGSAALIRYPLHPATRRQRLTLRLPSRANDRGKRRQTCGRHERQAGKEWGESSRAAPRRRAPAASPADAARQPPRPRQAATHPPLPRKRTACTSSGAMISSRSSRDCRSRRAPERPPMGWRGTWEKAAAAAAGGQVEAWARGGEPPTGGLCPARAWAAQHRRAGRQQHLGAVLDAAAGRRRAAAARCLIAAAAAARLSWLLLRGGAGGVLHIRVLQLQVRGAAPLQGATSRQGKEVRIQDELGFGLAGQTAARQLPARATHGHPNSPAGRQAVRRACTNRCSLAEEAPPLRCSSHSSHIICRRAAGGCVGA